MMENNSEYSKFDLHLLRLTFLIHEYTNARIRDNGEYQLYKQDIIEFMRKILDKEKKWQKE